MQLMKMLTKASTTSNFAIRIDRVEIEMRKRTNGTVLSRRSEEVQNSIRGAAPTTIIANTEIQIVETVYTIGKKVCFGVSLIVLASDSIN